MISLEFNENKPLFLQVYQHIKNEIISGNLKKHTMLPSKRNLSINLGVSVNTVTKAYENLIDEGYIYSKERIGYFVSEVENLITIKENPPAKLTYENKSFKYDFSIHKNKDFKFPNTNFKKVVLESLKDHDMLNSRNVKGLSSLRNSISNYLKYSRNVTINKENIIVSSGIEYLFQILLYILPKDSVFALENPGYKNLKMLLNLNNKKYNFIDVDNKGMSFESLKKTNSNVFLITPSHQFPTGSIMTIDRRIQLLNYAKKISGYIIEDDYDSEFKYYGRPITALKSLDNLNRVIYISNFSKSISPTLRVSYMVLPNDLLKKYEELKPFLNCPVPNIIQHSLSKFIDEAYFERHLNKMRKLYDEKRKFAISLFSNDKNFSIIDKKAGLHFILEVNLDIDENEIINSLRKKEIYIDGLLKYYEFKPKYKKPRIILGFGNLSEDDLEKGINIIKNEINLLSQYYPGNL